MSGNKKVIADIVSRIVDSGKIVGGTLKQRAVTPLGAVANRPITLCFKSYNPSLIKEDFIEVLPNDMQKSTNFSFLRKRDPKFFQFQDTYYLIFDNYHDLNNYYNETKLSQINKVRTKFTPILSNSNDFLKMTNILNQYSKNLLNAYQSKNDYFSNLKEPSGINAMNNLDKLSEIESRSSLVWNLPNEISPNQVRDIFWFYDIKHCFKLYWNDNNISSRSFSLFYFAFNNANDSKKFKNNFHGTYFNDKHTNKLLIENLH